MLNLPVDHAEFMRLYFEQQPLICPAAIASDKVGWSDLDNVLQFLEPDPAVLQLFLNGQIDPARYSIEKLQTGKHVRLLNRLPFYDLLQRGATLVLNRTEDYFAGAKHLCDAIARFTGQPTSGNSYISFDGNGAPGEGAFGQHWDTHDVFAVQWIGKKRWRLYEPTLPLPMSHQTSRRTQHRCPDRPSYEFILEAGDLLYIPRGWWHEVTSLDCASWHFSVGTYPQNIADYILWVCSRQLPSLLDARRTFVDSDDLSRLLDDVMQSLNQRIFNRETQNDFLRENRARVNIQPPFCTEVFANAHAAIPDDAVISWCGAFPPDIHATELAVPNGRLQLSPASRAIIQFLHRNGSADWQHLRATLANIPESALHETVVNLATHDLLCIQRVEQ